jgi:undecaprenol kinase
VEWLFVIFAIGGMFALELLNTAIERLVDLVTMEYHPLAKQAKDIAAGAVFLYAIFSVIVGFIIFIPRILKLIFHFF